MRALREAGFRVTLVSGPGELLLRTAAAEGVEWCSVSMRRQIAFFSDAVSLFRLCGLLRRVRPDLVEFSTPKAGLLGTLAARICRVPRRIYMLRGLRLERTNGVKRRLLLAAEKLAASSAHVVLCNSESLRASALAAGIAPAEKLRILGGGSSNGVDTYRYSPGESHVRQQFSVPLDVPVVGFVGRLTRDKGLPELIEAFETIVRAEPHTHLLLVGGFDHSEDRLSAELRNRILSHPRIRMTGYVEQTAEFYRAMDVMVLPSWREGFPNAVLEAAATGIPVVTTTTTGSRDSVVPEVTGLLIPPGYPEAISEAVLKLLRDPERRRQMGRAARSWVLEHYIDERVLKLTTDFYRSLLPSAVAQC